MNNLQTYPELDSVRITLEGVSLIEAAAGTGKTHNIQNLAARLIVEKNFPIGTIVIVTFTEKAAGELADRLRIVLETLVQFLQNGSCNDSAQQKRAKELIEAFDAKGIPRTVQLQRLQEALRDFDENRVSTIHGFCARVLKENAFESSVVFKQRLEKNIDFYIDKLLGDFCRIQRYSSDPLPGAELLDVKSLHNPIKTMLSRNGLQFSFVRKSLHSRKEILARLDELQNKIREDWFDLQIFADLKDCLKNINSMPGNKYLEYCRKLVSEIEESDHCNWQEFYRKVKPLRASIFIDGAHAKSKNNREKVRELVEDCDLFKFAEDYCMVIESDCQVYFQLKARDFVREKLDEWKSRDNFMGFDDLLNGVQQALIRSRLCDALQKKFNAGIIDEFQDTDMVQYDIFKRIFIQRPDPVFFMVGDPRQAIYSFRGGDLATYMTARKECIAAGGGVYTLTTNYRSSKPLINAFNRFFRHNSLFASNDIVYNNARVPDDKPVCGMLLDGEELYEPLQMSVDLEANTNSLLESCAEDILKMLTGKCFRLPEKDTFRDVEPGDIAVLAYDNYALETMRNLLEMYNIPTVCERKRGVWSSSEAGELAAFMQGVLENDRDNSVRIAMLGIIGNMNISDLDSLQVANQNVLLEWRLALMELERCWKEKGTAVFMRTVFSKYALKSRWATWRGGERIIANMTQLGDLLAAAELNNHLSPRGVLNYLYEKIAGGINDDEAAEMLESNRSAVRLMTVHASKGLQFPIVFLPQLAGRYPLQREDLKVYHRGDNLYCNPDELDKSVRLTAGIEELQEIMRLVYVAVTRARYGCFVSWGKMGKDINYTPMHWLCCMRGADTDDLENQLAGFLHTASGFKLPEASFTVPSILLDKQPLSHYFYHQQQEVELVPPESFETVQNQWGIVSYSSLIFDADDDTGGFDFDRNDDEEVKDTAPSASRLAGGIWDIPGGAAVGNAWHKILEVSDFTQGFTAERVGNILRIFGFDDPDYAEKSSAMFNRLMQYTLPCNMQLKTLDRARRLNEFEFLLSSPKSFAVEDMINAVERYMISEFGENFRSQSILDAHKGLFTGFIDMVFEYDGKFYIVDWKSNTLDRREENFSGDLLKRAMFEASYPMQYLCYLAALMRYLEQRLGKSFDKELYDKYIGGVYYIFLRGMMLETPAGIFSTQVPFETIQMLADVICPSDAGEVYNA